MNVGTRSAERRGVPLFWRTFLLNAAILVAAGFVLTLSPATVSSPVSLSEAAVLTGGAAAMLVLNLLLVRRAFAPLERLTALMRRVEPRRPGQRIPVYSADPEVVDLTSTFNAMLDRLESERRDSARRALTAQEDERARIARELHDEVGQSLTAALLHLERAARDAGSGLPAGVSEAQAVLRETVDEVREIARRLRPEALEDLGLRSALLALCERIRAGAGIDVATDLPTPLPTLTPEQEIVTYRVAQEALTNVARHAGARRVELSLRRHDGMGTLRVVDDGCGIGSAPSEGTGIEGMRERALLVGADFVIDSPDGRGTAVILSLPVEGS